ncbi:MAG: DUF5076 domain-containing protein [Myxococcota bacterium]
MLKLDELPIPSSVEQAEQSIEILRVWAADGKQHVSLAGELWEDPAAWGLMLVDLARHVARVYEQTSHQPSVEVLERIREGFDAEWHAPTDEPTGATEA